MTPEPLVSESPSPGVSRPPPLPGESSQSDAGSVVPGATGSHSTAGAGGGPKGGQDKNSDESGKGRTSGDGWKSGDGEKWYAQLVQACQEYRNGTIAVGKKKQLEEAAKGPAGVKRFCDGLLSGGSGGDGHYGGAPGHGDGGDDGGGTGGDDGDDDGGGGSGGGGDGPQHGGPADGGGTDGGIGGGSDGGTDSGGTDGGGTDGGGTDGGSGPPPTDWPGGDSGDSGETVAPSQPPVTPDDGANSGTDQATP